MPLALLQNIKFLFLAGFFLSLCTCHWEHNIFPQRQWRWKKFLKLTPVSTRSPHSWRQLLELSPQRQSGIFSDWQLRFKVDRNHNDVCLCLWGWLRTLKCPKPKASKENFYQIIFGQVSITFWFHKDLKTFYSVKLPSSKNKVHR